MANNLLSFDAPGVPLISSLELLAVVNAAREEQGENPIRRNDFHNRVRDELDGDHYETFVVAKTNGGSDSTAMRLTQDQCVLVAMRESKAVRRVVLDKLKTLSAPKIPTHAEALRLAADALEALEATRAADAEKARQLEQQKPHVEFSQAVMGSEATISIADMAKLLCQNGYDTGRNRLTSTLKVDGYLLQDGTAYQRYVQYFEVDESKFVDSDGKAHIRFTPRITPKGQAYFLKHYTAKRKPVSFDDAKPDNRTRK